MLKRLKKNALILLSIVLLFSCGTNNDAKVLVFTKTAGFRHASIETGVAALQKLGEENGFQVDTSENAELITEENLKTYAAVIFLNTTGDILNHIQQADFERYIQSGGGFVGIHSAADTEYDWIWYGRMIGAYFNGHPEIQKATVNVVDKNHPATKMLPDAWDRTDEWYNYKSIRSEINPLLNLDESSYKGGTNGKDHPIAWYHDYDGGRAFYTGGGHTDECYSEPLFLAHLLGGINYAIGNDKRDYAKAKFHRVPEDNRFVKTVLGQNLSEPMELDVFEDGRVMVVERRGNIKLYDPQIGLMDSITKIPVYSKEEDGLIGFAIDPDYENNKWIYLNYSPVDGEPRNQVSRFIFDGDSLDYSSEVVIIEIPVQRDECCHTGGSLEFGPDGNLFITTGDNTNPFASDGFAPIDEQAGRKAWDAQGSSSNSNDLRGKILRIKVQDDGTYTIPEGNLFPKGTANARPEIYVMGCRNPFRMGIDHKTKYVYWGDVGPDAGTDSLGRGPKGYDEFNQARKAGYYGWPYFRGDGKTYDDYSFDTKMSGGLFNPEKPINDSPNNTGLRELPPFQKSMIWYSYDASEEFPWLGVGGKNPMAGPVYHDDMHKGKDKYPPYFNGRLFIYEWMRHWIYTVKFDENGDIIKVDPFMQNETFSRPMDMIFGKDGKLYMIEYGELWFARNLDARLVRLDYVTGNRNPVAKIKAEETIGAAPFSIVMSGVESYDFDGDKLKYEWDFGDGTEKNLTAFPSHTFQKPGIYQVILKVTDEDGRTSAAKQEIQVGNAPPKVAWEIIGNKSFYWDNAQFDYQVNVSDDEDGTTADNSLDKKNVQVSIDYLPQGYDMTTVAQGHQKAPSAPKGKQLIDKSDCKSCHAKNKKVNGPSYIEIANRYRGDDFAARDLSKKIIKGGAGEWGQTVMSAHPQLTEEETTEMALYILSLTERKKVQSSYPTEGAFVTKEHVGQKEKGRYVLMATYTDNGHQSIKPITAREQIILNYPKIYGGDFDEASKGIMIDGSRAAYNIHEGDYTIYRDIDFTDVSELVGLFWQRKSQDVGGMVEFRLDDVKGVLLGKVEVVGTEREVVKEYKIKLDKVKGLQDLYVVYTKSKVVGKPITLFKGVKFNQ